MPRLLSMSCALLFIAPAAAQAQAPAAAKPVEIYVGSSVGAGYDLYARLLSRHIGRHLPGNPSVVVKNMDGAGGLRVANWLFGVAPKDGSVLATIGRGIPFDNLLDPKKVTFDGRRFGWVGSMNNEVSVCVSWHTSPVKTLDDMLTTELAVGASGAGGDSVVFPTLLNAMLGTRMKIISGYPGGNEISLALERGEVQGRCGWSWSSANATSAKWFESRQVRVLTQIGLSKHPDLPHVPLALDMAKTSEQRDALRLVFARNFMAWPYATPPGTAPERIQEFRTAFMAATRDPALLAEAKASSGFEIRPVSGEEIEKLLEQTYATSAAVVQRTAELLR